MAADFRVFLSAVTSEFGAARDAVANDLQARDLQLRVQRSFRQEAESDTLLRLLHDYIAGCNAVVCVIGRCSGGCPPPAAAAEFPDILPTSMTEASYTQWEFFFARKYKRRLSLYLATVDYRPDQDQPTGDDCPELQDAFIAHIKAEGLHYTLFSNRDQLRAEVLKEAWPEKPRARPIMLPYASLGRLFKGRDEFLRRLRENLTRDRGGATAIASMALYGMGGIGKTRAAIEYAWVHRDDYTALLFAQADSPEELRRNLAGLAGPLHLAERDEAEEEVRFNAVLAWLRANPGWLLILDNIDTAPALAEADRLMGRLTGGHVLLTSRLDRFARQVETLELDMLSQADAAAFLLEATEGRRRKTADDDAAARELAEELGRLALALEQAASTIDKLRCGFRRYLEIWQSNREKAVGWAKPEITGYHHAVAATWQTSVDQLTDAGKHLIERLAFLAPDPLPMFLLDVAVPDAQAEDLYDALADITSVSLVTRDAEGERFAVHRLVQEVTRTSLDTTVSRSRITEAVRWINAAFDGDAQDVVNWPRFDPLAPHAWTVTQWADSVRIAEPTSQLMNSLGLLLNAKSLYAQAEPLFRRALTIAEAYFGPEHPEVAVGLNNLSVLTQATNRLSEAEPLIRRALAIDEATFGPDHPLVAGLLNNLAHLLQASNRLTEAEPLIRRALAIDEATFGLEHPAVAGDLNNLGQLLRLSNQLVEAEPLMRRALAIDEASLGPDHPIVGRDLNNLAQLLQIGGRPAEAEPVYRRALVIHEASLGPSHPTVATCLNNLATLLQLSGRHAEAEPLFRRALAIDEATFGPDHPEVAADLGNLAQLLQATDRLAEAESLMRRVLTIFIDFERETGHRQPYHEALFGNFARLLTAMGRSETEIKAVIASITGGDGPRDRH
jgi:tetratricopeptide (TPR) repeat protein